MGSCREGRVGLRLNQVADIGAFPRKYFVVKILLPVDIGDAVLQFPNACAQRLLLLRQQDLALRDGALALQAEGEVVLHLLNAHAALFQADQAADPGDVPVIKHPAVVFVPLDVGDKPLVAVKFQGLIGHVGLLAGLHHGVQHNRLPRNLQNVQIFSHESS